MGDLYSVNLCYLINIKYHKYMLKSHKKIPSIDSDHRINSIDQGSHWLTNATYVLTPSNNHVFIYISGDLKLPSVYSGMGTKFLKRHQFLFVCVCMCIKCLAVSQNTVRDMLCKEI